MATGPAQLGRCSLGEVRCKKAAATSTTVTENGAEMLIKGRYGSMRALVRLHECLVRLDGLDLFFQEVDNEKDGSHALQCHQGAE
eukprot:CAMPEP_0194513006 /NCGR_PEP_ID=MMETSP0253-20130528/45175_1 /TAXON_ID=2966 /ORGANISM="Noctiluca scintillans" /LENGTH=84 /DNA_ID=CAMNT_0039356519 /DNA_START=238 /DNA_END=493 /DNA_ORIENTATION=-